MSTWLLTEIREGDGAQRYENPEAPDPGVIWLCGIDRAPGVELGKRYVLGYDSTRFRGRYTVKAAVGPLWPLYGSAAEARCFKCAAGLAGAKDSGNAPGHGQYSAYCSACDMLTFFDLTNGS